MRKHKEKRSINRVAIHQSICFEMSIAESGRFRNILKNGRGVDLSRYGIGLRTDNLLSRGEVLKLYFPVGKANTSVPVFTEVMWAMPLDGSEGEFRVGLRFLA
jgi:hypothetical protein